MAKPHALLRESRAKLGLSCKEMAKRLRIPEPTLRSLENGWRPITAERAVELETKLGIPREELCDLFRRERVA